MAWKSGHSGTHTCHCCPCEDSNAPQNGDVGPTLCDYTSWQRIGTDKEQWRQDCVRQNSRFNFLWKLKSRSSSPNGAFKKKTGFLMSFHWVVLPRSDVQNPAGCAIVLRHEPEERIPARVAPLGRHMTSH